MPSCHLHSNGITYILSSVLSTGVFMKCEVKQSMERQRREMVQVWDGVGQSQRKSRKQHSPLCLGRPWDGVESIRGSVVEKEDGGHSKFPLESSVWKQLRENMIPAVVRVWLSLGYTSLTQHWNHLEVKVRVGEHHESGERNEYRRVQQLCCCLLLCLCQLFKDQKVKNYQP